MLNRVLMVLLVVSALVQLGMTIRGQVSKADTRVTENCGSAKGCGVLVFDGDSVSAGVAANPGQGPDLQLMRKMKAPAKAVNIAVGGRPVYECLRLFDKNAAPLYDHQAPFNIILFHAGDNDVNQHKTGAETYRALTHYIVQAHKQGWKFVISTELARPGFPRDFQKELAEYNLLVLQNKAGADAVVDFGNDPRMTVPTARADPAVFAPDQVHPSDGGYAILAQMLLDAINPMIGTAK